MLKYFIYYFVTYYKVKQFIFQAKLSTMILEFDKVILKLDKIKLKRIYVEDKFYKSMTTNLVKCMN